MRHPILASLLLFSAVPAALAQDEPQDAPAEGQAMGLLEISASVDGATVHVDYEEVGKTPLLEYVPPGTYSVRVAADGFQPFVRRVEIFADSTTKLDASLIPGEGTVEFIVEPKGARVLLDNQDVGGAPIRLTDVSRGHHSYEVRAPRYETLDGEFDFERGQNILLVHTLASAEGRFEITSTPEGATVFMNDEEIGVTPIVLKDVDPAIHYVRLEMKGYGTVLRTVDTSTGEKGEVAARLSEDYARQSFKGAVSEAQWYVDDQLIGEGSKLSTSLARGTYELRVEAPGYTTLETPLIVDSEGREPWKVTLAEAGGGASKMDEATPLVKNWIFWTAVGVGVAGAGTGVAIANRPEEAEPLPSGDVAVTLP